VRPSQQYRLKLEKIWRIQPIATIAMSNKREVPPQDSRAPRRSHN
jgi:hypothetical protein